MSLLVAADIPASISSSDPALSLSSSTPDSSSSPSSPILGFSTGSCGSYLDDCSGCTSEVGCGWCTGEPLSGSRFFSSCMAGNAEGPIAAGQCQSTAGAIWRYSPTSPENPANCGDSTCSWACNLECAADEDCITSIVYSGPNGNTYSCLCDARPWKWAGVSLAGWIGIGIGAFVLLACTIMLSYWYCCCLTARRRRIRSLRSTPASVHHMSGQTEYEQQQAEPSEATTTTTTTTTTAEDDAGEGYDDARTRTVKTNYHEPLIQAKSVTSYSAV